MAVATVFRESYKFVDRTNWGRGPWDSEKDFYRWTDFQTKLECVVVRTNLGALTGSVLFPTLAPMSEPYGIVHGQVPRVDRMLGRRTWTFHCAADQDGIPALCCPDDTYRCLDYVTITTQELAMVVAENLVNLLREEKPRGWFGTMPYPYTPNSGVDDSRLPNRD